MRDPYSNPARYAAAGVRAALVRHHSPRLAWGFVRLAFAWWVSDLRARRAEDSTR